VPEITPEHSGEFARIARYFAPLARGAPGAFGLTDDAAVIAIADGMDLVVTNDTMVAGVHYVGDEPPGLVARKLLRVSLSDLAAMGARPLGYSLSVALPAETGDAWLADFAAGLAEDQEAFGCHLLGGDSVATPGPITLALTAYGEVAAGSALRRSGARPGDRVFVSGTVGDGALGLRVARGELAALPAAQRAALLDRYRLPQPRLRLGQALVGLAHAAIDLSDGLVADLGHICETSDVAAEIEAAAVPLSDSAVTARGLEPGRESEILEAILTGGDDYELLFTVSDLDSGSAADAAARAGTPITEIGRIVAGTGITVRGDRGQALSLARAGYRHF
jgi:thiamine-monophosphate kinase